MTKWQVIHSNHWDARQMLNKLSSQERHPIGDHTPFRIRLCGSSTIPMSCYYRSNHKFQWVHKYQPVATAAVIENESTTPEQCVMSIFIIAKCVIHKNLASKRFRLRFSTDLRHPLSVSCVCEQVFCCLLSTRKCLSVLVHGDACVRKDLVRSFPLVSKINQLHRVKATQTTSSVD